MYRNTTGHENRTTIPDDDWCRLIISRGPEAVLEMFRNMRRRHDELEDEVEDLSAWNRDLRMEKMNNEAELEEFAEHDDYLRGKIEELEDDNGELEIEINRLRHAMTNMVLDRYGPPPPYEDTITPEAEPLGYDDPLPEIID